MESVRKKKIVKRSVLIGLATLLLVVGVVCAVLIGQRVEDDRLEELRREALIQLEKDEGSYDPQSIVLRDTSRTAARELAELLGGTLRITENGDFATITLPEGMTIIDAYSREAVKSRIPEMSADYHVSLAAVEELTASYDRAPVMPEYSVGDPLYVNQSYLGYINLGTTWNRTHGDSVKVAVIDTGIDTDHPEFAGKISEYSYNASTDKIVKDYDISVIEDEQGHGTAVAGVISSQMNDGNGITGIAPAVELIVIKAECTPDGKFKRTSDLVFGLYYAVERDVDVVNMSFGTSGEENPFEAPAQLAVDSDIICVAAAGNEGTSSLVWPAADENVIGVGALDFDSWELAEYSNYGDNSDMVAPGTVYTCKMGGGYRYINGTSFSSPVTAAAIALYRATVSSEQGEYANVREVLFASCLDLGDLGEDWYYGYGALDVNALVVEEKGTITFDMLTDELEVMERVYVKGHTLQNIPVDVERNYAVFDGWFYGYDCAEGDELELYTTKFTKDITLYAKWVNEDDGVPYTYVVLDDGSVEIRSYTGRRRFITVPDMIEGRVVSSIGERAFEGQTRLREVKLPSTLTRIKLRAFYGCSSLSNISIPDSVHTIEEYAFFDCARLTAINFGAGSVLDTVGQLAFAKSGIYTFDLPKTVTSIDGSAFFGATNLKRINVVSGNDYFASLDGVLITATGETLVAYPARIRGEYTLPAGITKIGDYAFGYSYLSAVDLSNVTSIGKSSFAYSQLLTVNIPDNVTLMGDEAFAYCELLQKVDIGLGIVKIPDGAFKMNASLAELKIGKNVQTIDAGSFAMCTSLTELDLSENSALVNISGMAFAKCLALTKVTFAEESSLLTIGGQAFDGNVSLKDIKLPAGLTTVGEYAFRGIAYEGIMIIPSSVRALEAGAFADCDGLTEFEVENNNSSYVDVNGVVYSTDMITLVAYPAGNAATSYTVLDGTKIVFNSAFYGADYPYCVNLPESLTNIERCAFTEMGSLSSMFIPDAVMQISNYAFSACYKLYSVDFGSNSQLTRLSENAFSNCGIVEFTIPANVSTVSQYVFSGCRRLRKLTFAENSKIETISAYMFSDCEQLEELVFLSGSSIKSISAHGLEGMSKLRSIDLSGTKLTNIDNFAFRFCTSLESIVIPEGVTDIGRYAFYQCESLTDVTLPRSIEFIGRYAFLGAENADLYFTAETLPWELQENWDYGIRGYYTGVRLVVTTETFKYAEVSGGGYAILDYFGVDGALDLAGIDLNGDGQNDSIITIGGYAFADSALTSINLPETLTDIGRYAFYNLDSLGKITIPSSVRFIGQYAFASCGIESLTFAGASKIENIEQYAFTKCKALTTVSLPDSLTKLGTGAFAESGLTSVVFGNGLTELPKNAFYRTKLTELKLPEVMEKVGYYAFAEIETLKGVSFGKTTTLMLMGNAFSGCALENVEISANVDYIGEFCFVGNRGLMNINVDPENPQYASVDGILYNKAKTKLITYPAGRSGSFTVPEFVEMIGFGAFENSKLTTVTFAEGINLLTIGNRAFYGSAITSISIPASVISIDYYAFATSESLETVLFASDNNLMGVYEGAFLGCRALTNITLPDTIIEISDFAFYGCENLREIPVNDTAKLSGIYDYAFAYTGISGDLVFTENLIDIGSYAFSGLDLTSVYLPSERAKELVIGLGAFKDCNELSEITLPFIGASFDDEEISWLGYIFGAGRYDANATYTPQSLKAVTIHEGTTIIGYGAFYGLSQLETIDIPYSVEEVYQEAFIDTTAIHSFENSILFVGDGFYQVYDGFFGKGLSGYLTFDFALDTPLNDPIIQSNAFSECTYLKGITIPDGIDFIGGKAFYKCTSLETVVIPESVTEIEFYAFDNCTSLESITLPDSITELWSGVFYECQSLRSVKLPANLQRLEGGMFYNCSALSEVQLPQGLRRIDEGAFNGCSSLTSITIPSSVNLIEDNAFVNCTKLKEITNLSSLSIILGASDQGGVALYAQKLMDAAGNVSYKDGYENINYIDTPDGWRFIYSDGVYTLREYLGDAKSAELPKDIQGNSFELDLISAPEVLIIPQGTTEIGPEMFRACAALKEVVLPEGLKTIESMAFFNCLNLRSIILPESLEKIGNSAFYNCKSLSEILIPDNVSELGYEAFGWCTTLTNIKLPKDLKTIPSYSFAGCESLKNIVIPSSVMGIRGGAFSNCASLKEIEIPANVTSIDASAFTGCTALQKLVVATDNTNFVSLGGVLYDKNFTTTVFVPDSVTSVELPATVTDFSFAGKANLRAVTFAENSQLEVIPGGAFSGCTSLTSIVIPNNVKWIYSSAFHNCTNLESVHLPDGITRIEAMTFNGCSKLSSIILPKKLESIGYNAFGNCNALKNIIIPDSVKTIDEYAFTSCTALESVHIPAGVTSLDIDAFNYCTNLSEINIDPNNSVYYSYDGIVYDKLTGKQLIIPIGYCGVIVIPDGVTAIGSGTEYHYAGYPKITGVVIPDSVTVIGSNAFYYCESLKSVTIPNSVTRIESCAFGYCKRLKNIEIPDSVSYIGESAFMFCSSLRSVEIPEGITLIESQTFFDCTNLLKVKLPSTLKTIERNGFAGLSNLYQIINNSNISLSFENREYGDITWQAKMITDASGNTTYAPGYGAFEINETEDGWVYMVESGTYTLIDYDGDAESATLPTMINGNEIEYALNSAPKHLIIPEGVVAIPSGAFSGCKYLETIEFPSSLEVIGQTAFYDCPDLKEINIPGNVKIIEGSAFAHCNNLVTVVLNDGVEYIGNYAFGNLNAVENKLTYLTIPSSVKYIGTNLISKESTLYNDPANWVDGNLFCGDHLLVLNPEAVSVEVKGAIAADVESYVLKTLIWGDCANDLMRFTNLETLVLNGMPESGLGEAPFTLKTVVIAKGVQLPRADVKYFDGITGIRIYVESDEEDCRWDENFPGWNNGNMVFYGDDCAHVVFLDHDGRVLSDKYMTGREIIIQPYIPTVKLVDNVGYKFLGWDLDGDGTVDPLPATTSGELTPVAVYDMLVHESGAHDFAVSVILSPTCTTTGYSTHTCRVCGYTERFDFVSKLDHDYEKSNVSPTCEGIGGDRYDCRNCEAFYFENELPALGHAVDTWTVLSDALCMVDGERTGLCSACGKQVTEIISATGHRYSLVSSSPATCTQKGTEIYSCTCGHSLRRTIPMTPHSYVKVTAPVEFTSWLGHHHSDALGGNGVYYSCAFCKSLMLAEEEKKESSSGGPSIMDASCPHIETTETVVGNVTTTVCDSCEKTVSIVYNGNHSEHECVEEIVPDVAPTCTTTGFTEGKRCSVCGEILVSPEIIDALGHTEVIDAAVAPTCTTTGLTEGKHCSVCNEVLVAQTVVDALGHTGGNATCTQRAQCERCGVEYGELAEHITAEEIFYNETEHWLECVCGQKFEVKAHDLNADGSCNGCAYKKPAETTVTITPEQPESRSCFGFSGGIAAVIVSIVALFGTAIIKKH